MKKTTISTNKIAEICGVSQGTVDRALNNRGGINPETKARILKVAKEYGYRPNIHASAIAGGKSMLIGVVVFDLKNQYFTDLITELEANFSENGYSIVTMFTNKDTKREIECIKTLYSMSVDAIIICPINKGEDFENFLASLEIPIVTVGNRLNRFTYVGVDNRQAMYDATKFVLESGYSNLIFVMPTIKDDENFSAPSDRLDGFISCVNEHNALHCVTDINNALNLPADSKTAFICTSDIYSIKLISLANKNGCGVIGFDNIDLIDTLSLNIDSVFGNAKLTAKSVYDIINKKTTALPIPHKIIKRGSI